MRPLSTRSIPLIDVAPLLDGRDVEGVARQIDAACRQHGFFVVTNHGIDERLQQKLARAAERFFSLPEETKQQIAMARGGRAWRGYFPVGGELTSGKPDLKEGVYFGTELPQSDARVQAGIALHGANLFPDGDVPELRQAVLAYIDAATSLGLTLTKALSVGLGLPERFIHDAWLADPTVLFRIFHYPPDHEFEANEEPRWGVGEHTDYGLLTLLLQDDVGGLEVKTPGGWVSVPPVPGSIVCNIGDMLDRMTGGRYRSTPHRVRNVSSRQRYSFPLFLDPSWGARIAPLPGLSAQGEQAHARWDGGDVHAFDGTWGEYLLGKVSKVFPELFRDVIAQETRLPLVRRVSQVAG